MKYTIRAGTLYRRDSDEPLCRIRGTFSEEKWIEDAAGGLCLMLEVHRDKCGKNSEICFHRYVMLDQQGREVATASPDYAAKEDPRINGWPLNRLPRVDQAVMRWQEQRYRLFQRELDSYVLVDCFDREAACFVHRGLRGGWNVTTRDAFPPAMVCGLFVFCRYLERENDMPLV